MGSFSQVFVIALCTQVFWAAAAPNTIEAPVRYDGDQLWKVQKSDFSKVVLDELQQSYGRFYFLTSSY